MRKLSGMDAAFLYMETNSTPMHISSLALCSPVQKGENAYEALKAQIVSRLHEIPSFHRKLKATPFHVDHPVWVEADIVDLDYHIKHASLPAPGNVEQLRMVVQGLHSLNLDRDRPLWQYYIIEGLEDEEHGLEKGSFALYTKGHHASLDGGAGISVMDIISDKKPTPRPPLPNRQIGLVPENPGFFALLGGAFGSFLQQQADLMTNAPKMVQAAGKVVKSIMDDREGFVDSLKPAPKTRFNVRIQKQRAFGASSIPLADALALAKQTGSKLNDVVLTVCGGALRRYLQQHDELSSQSLVATVPVSLREIGDKSSTNRVTALTCPIGTDIDDPLERLRKVTGNTKKRKEQLGAVKDVIPTDYSFLGAPIVMTGLAYLGGNTDLVDRLPPISNVLISNVPGPRRPMYFAGSKVMAYYPVSIPSHGSALNITVQSYVDRMDFGLVACKVAVPDVQDIADYIVEEFEALELAVSTFDLEKVKLQKRKEEQLVEVKDGKKSPKRKNSDYFTPGKPAA